MCICVSAWTVGDFVSGNTNVRTCVCLCVCVFVLSLEQIAAHRDHRLFFSGALVSSSLHVSSHLSLVYIRAMTPPLSMGTHCHRMVGS